MADAASPATADARFALIRPTQGDGSELWSLRAVSGFLEARGIEVTGRSAGRYMERWGLSVPEGPSREVLDKVLSERAVEPGRRKVLTGGVRSINGEYEGEPLRGYQLYARDGRGQLLWSAFPTPPRADDIATFLGRLEQTVSTEAVLVLQSVDLSRHEPLKPWLMGERPVQLLTTPHWPAQPAKGTSNTEGPGENSHPKDSDPISSSPVGWHKAEGRHPPLSHPEQSTQQARQSHSDADPSASRKPLKRNPMALTHLQRLEAESIQIMREVVAETENPVMLYSIGKDSAVMLHLAMKAFAPSVPPFPLLHVDTTWKFQEMYKFRARMAKETGMKLIVHVNEEGRAQGINPFTHGSAIHTDIMKTEALKQALTKYGFDAAFGGARRDEEKSRAKERIFSFRTANHRWDPKNQRPEIWKLYNARKHPKESIRVFPLSNWTELDIWQYIHLEQIPIVPLYYSAERPVVERDGTLIMVDDDRMPLNPGEVPMMKKVRFRTLGCYPLTGAVESEADTLPDIIQEMLLTRTSERQGRMIDHDSSASMEKKKQEGYF
ncbi:sulfate adenylyltransferase subunit CysD [Marinimicrobium sp. LS-A18]|uniref:sulfate adenylyltransferase subunit CysD n=1 Tax=Marinimicrobium sp. LS-A18 TaxID=1381596 RepID=UPI003510AC0E